jgi:hypothetical protein
MKKVFLFLAFFIFLTGCSDSEISSISDQTSTLKVYKKISQDDLKKEYEALQKSLSHKIFIEASNNFISKMKFNDDIKLIESEVTLLKWISDNISITEFSNIEEATEEWKIIIELKSNEIVENKNFYNLIKDATEEQLINVFTPEFEQVTLGECEKTCNYGRNRCLLGAAVRFAKESMDTAAIPFVSAAGQAYANLSYLLNQATCTKSYGLCLEGCEFN